MGDKLEFYEDNTALPFLTLHSSFQPNEGDLVNIRKVTYEVIGRSFTVDHAGKADEGIRCNVILHRKRPQSDTAAEPKRD